MALLAVLGAAIYGGYAAAKNNPPGAPSITASPAAFSGSQSASFTYSDTDSIQKFQCSLDGSSFADCGTTNPATKTPAYSGLTAGSHTFQVKAVNTNGTSSATSYTWTIDLTAPTVLSINRVAASPTNAASVSWTVTFKEDVTGVDAADFSFARTGALTGGSISSVTPASGQASIYTVTSTSGSGDGTIGLNVTDNDTITDKAGNKLGGTGTGNGNFTGQTYTIDKTGPANAPTITAGPASGSSVSSTSVSFSFSTGESGVAGFQCKLDATAAGACTNPKSYSSLAQGSHTFAVWAVDALGNSGPSATRSWTVDTVIPAVPAITAKPAGLTNQTTANFSFTGEAGATFLCSLDGSAFAAGCTSPKSYPGLSSGSHTFQVEQRDAAGNTSAAASYTWTIDLTPPPAPALSAKPTNPSDSANPSFAFTATESGETFLCSLDGSSFTGCANPINYSGLSGGSHTFQVKGQDLAGNVSTSPTSYTWSIVPSAPSITAKPANPTNQTSATFSFTDSFPGATFQCALDTPTFTACTSPKPYSGLTAGPHTFQVRAVSGSAQSVATSYTWSIDTAPPSITVTFPTAGGVYNQNGWNGGCAGGAGICGSATDPSGVASGQVSILQQSSGKYWSGSAFNSSSEVFNNASQTGGSGSTYTGRYPLSLPPDGLYTIRVRATDNAGNTTASGSYVTLSFRIDNTKPPKPVFDSTPPNPNSTATSTFAWHDGESPVTYECSKENGSFQPCTTPLTYNVQTTNNGEHQFAVRAIDAAGNVSDVASYNWKVGAGTPAQFVIHGSVTGLAPGITKPVPLTIDNPNNVTIFITQLTFVISANASSGTCLPSSYTVGPWSSNPPSTPDLQVPANATGFAVPTANQPSIKLNNSAANQDNCKGKSFTLTFSGSAHS